jgi:hypothetical protein
MSTRNWNDPMPILALLAWSYFSITTSENGRQAARLVTHNYGVDLAILKARSLGITPFHLAGHPATLGSVFHSKNVLYIAK